jgi:hypothetical protein
MMYGTETLVETLNYRITPMIAFIPVLFPLVPVLLGAGAGAATVAACSTTDKKKAKIARLKARIEALERKT